MVKIALIGDIHLAFNDTDVTFFNRSDYDLLLFVGDLARYRYRETLQMARVMAKLEKTAVYIPGNHDTVTSFQMLGEIKSWPWLKWLSSVGHTRRVRRTKQLLGNVVLGGYQTHPFSINNIPFDIITARPFAFGESGLSYPHYLKRHFGVGSEADSIAKLKRCVDAAQSGRILFLAHTGPFGLGNGRSDIWGIDYKPNEGDNGDKDLQAAIAYAKAEGKQVLGVCAGHMHHKVRKAGLRSWHVIQDDTHYVNAARVPRIFEKNGRMHHHYIELQLTATNLTVTEKQFTP